jgi:hypothetical protein
LEKLWIRKNWKIRKLARQARPFRCDGDQHSGRGGQQDQQGQQGDQRRSSQHDLFSELGKRV